MNPLFSLGIAVGRNVLLRREPGIGLPTSPASFRIAVKDPSCRDRISRILQGFFTGFEMTLRSPGIDSPLQEPDAEFLQPFFHEGRAMGIAARLSFRRDGPERFAGRAAAGEEDPYVFLKHVGLGFWLGFSHPRSPGRVEEIARRVGKYGDLVLDGYGFKAGFFDFPRNPDSVRRLLGIGGPSPLSPSAVLQVANGLGRSRWFFHMDDPPAAFEEARTFQDAAPAVLGGLGLASAFTWTDDLARAYSAADALPEDGRRRFVKGIRIALYVRDADQRAFLEGHLGRLPDPLQARARGDLEISRQVGRETRPRADFIAAFHRGCWER